MLNNNFRFRLELSAPDTSIIGFGPLEVDWEPAVECAEFEAMRMGQLPPVYGETDCTVEPVWHETLGEPTVAGFRLAFDGDRSRDEFQSSPFSLGYFEAAILAAGAEHHQSESASEHEKLRYRVLAFGPTEKEPTAFKFETEDVAQPLPLRSSSLPAARANATATGETAEDSIPVFVPALLLEEIAELSRSAGEKETGGILIGHLHRDDDENEIFASVTTQLSAQHTEAELMKLTFTSETWTDVRHALELRRQEEIMLGWWHSHPARAWCKDCSLESQQQCRYARGFFSSHDRALHRTMFPRAYSLALVVNDVAFGQPSFSMFGWKEGGIVERDFYVVR